MKNIMLIISLLSLLFACENVEVAPVDMATIEGTVTIGPLCGNIPAIVYNSNPCGFSDEQIDQIYAKYKVTVNGMSDGKAVNKEYVLNRTGKFTFEVPVGTYSVEVILPEGGSAAQNTLNPASSLKKELTVTKNQVVKIDIMVNTGIL
jgi:hypothetical protein